MYKSLSQYSLILVLMLVIPAVLYLTSCNQEETQNETLTETSTDSMQSTEAASSSETATEESSMEDTTNDETSGNDEAVEKKGGNPVVIIKTSKGDIKVELDKENAPISTDNFLAYVQDGYYDGTIFHRVINNFMIQGGGFMADGQQKPTKEPIKNEADNGLKNDRGTIAMARTGVVDSATSQFYINHVDNDFLNHGKRDFGYAVFGKVVDGMDVVDAIAAVQTGPGDVPNEQIVIESVTVVE
jgi:peptidyl-prolyl cis-trans isomerase A (cyclophilin A)